jgi:type IV pilus assembly protein PilW
MSYSPENNEQGFTVVELVVGLAISLVLLGIAVKIFLVQQRSYNVQEQLAEMQQNIRSTMDMIVRETKMAGYDPLNTAIPVSGIIYSPTQLQILTDIDGSGTATGIENEDITYSYNGTDSQIIRNTAGVDSEIAGNIQAFNFNYYDSNGIPTTASANIRQMQLSITGRTAKADPELDRVDGPAAFGYRYGTLTTFVTPENLGF